MSVLSHRARLAAHKRHHPDADHSDLERDLAAAGLEEHIRRVVESAPTLTAEQVDRLRGLLPAASKGGGDVDAPAA